MEIKGEKVNHLLIEEKAEILHEFFITVSVDRGARRPVILKVYASSNKSEKVCEAKTDNWRRNRQIMTISIDWTNRINRISERI